MKFLVLFLSLSILGTASANDSGMAQVLVKSIKDESKTSEFYDVWLEMKGGDVLNFMKLFPSDSYVEYVPWEGEVFNNAQRRKARDSNRKLLIRSENGYEIEIMCSSGHFCFYVEEDEKKCEPNPYVYKAVEPSCSLYVKKSHSERSTWDLRPIDYEKSLRALRKAEEAKKSKK